MRNRIEEFPNESPRCSPRPNSCAGARAEQDPFIVAPPRDAGTLSSESAQMFPMHAAWTIKPSLYKENTMIRAQTLTRWSWSRMGTRPAKWPCPGLRHSLRPPGKAV